MSAIRQEMRQWLTDDWNKVDQEGVREMSIVTATNIIGLLATQQYAEQAVAQCACYMLETLYCESLEVAKRSVAHQCATCSSVPPAAAHS